MDVKDLWHDFTEEQSSFSSCPGKCLSFTQYHHCAKKKKLAATFCFQCNFDHNSKTLPEVVLDAIEMQVDFGLDGIKHFGG